MTQPIPPIRIKTFRSRTLDQALARIRAEFGSDAAILETKRIAGRITRLRRARFEVTASSRVETQNAPHPTDAAESSISLQQSSTSELLNQHDASVTDSSSATELPSTTNESAWRSLNSVSQKSNRQSTSDLDYTHAFQCVYQELIDANIDRQIASDWIAAVRDTCGDELIDEWRIRATIAQWIRGMVDVAEPWRVQPNSKQIVALVGPSGVGKSTCIAKLAGLASCELGMRVGLISIDTERADSASMLARYCELMHWPFAIAPTDHALSRSLNEMHSCDMVFIDTTSCVPGDIEAMQRIVRSFEIAQPTQKHLVLSAATCSSAFLNFSQWFDGLNTTHLILSKLDESAGLGSVFPCLMRCQLPLSFLSTGRKIPGDLLQATGARIAQCVMSQTPA